jgi:glutathione S-transferase
MSTLKVFWAQAPFAYRVLLYLEARRIPYESNMISFDKKEQKSPQFIRMNPRGKVPTIADGDIYVYESMAIIDYLEHKFTDLKKYPSLVGNDLRQRANIMVKANEVHSNFNLVRIAHPLLYQNPKVTINIYLLIIAGMGFV